MAIRVMANSGGTVKYTAEELGAAFNAFAGGNDFIVGKCGDEMAITTSGSSLNVTIKTGKAIINGRTVLVDEPVTLTLPAGSTDGIYVVLRVDLTRPVGQEGYFTYVTSSQIKEDYLNNSGSGQHDLPIALIKTDVSGVTSSTDQRNVMENVGGAKIRVIHDSDGDKLETPIDFEIVYVKGS